MQMPFGKHKGMDVDHLPDDYMKWLHENIELRGKLRKEIQQRIKPSGGNGDSLAENPKVVCIVKDVYRQLAFKYHPDQGGHVSAMQALNEFNELLLIGIQKDEGVSNE